MSKTTFYSMIKCWLSLYVAGVAAIFLQGVGLSRGSFSIMTCYAITIIGITVPRLLTGSIALIEIGESGKANARARENLRIILSGYLIATFATSVITVAVMSAANEGVESAIFMACVAVGLETLLQFSIWYAGRDLVSYLKK